MLKRFGCPERTKIVRIKCRNNLVKPDYRFITRRVRPMPGFKNFASASPTLADIEIVNMIRQGQFRPEWRPFQQFCQLAD